MKPIAVSDGIGDNRIDSGEVQALKILVEGESRLDKNIEPVW